MNDSQLIDGIRKSLNGDRAVSPVIAVALLILIAIGFAVAIQGVGSDLIGSVQEPPEASIDDNPEQDNLRLTVENVQNADELQILHNGSEINSEDINGDDVGLDPETGDSTVIPYRKITTEEDGNAGSGTGAEISVVAVDFPDNERVVYTYTVPENANT